MVERMKGRGGSAPNVLAWFLGLTLMGWLSMGQAEDAYSSRALVVYQVEKSAQALADSTGRRISQIQSLFVAIETLLSNNLNDDEVHRALNRMIKGIPFVRAFIIIGENGTLAYDSSVLPAASMDLSDRLYFQQTVKSPLHDLWVAPPISGRSSSLPFIPMTSRIHASGKDWVVVAIVIPDQLIDPAFRCPACAVILLDGQGNLLASAPAGYQIPSILLREIQAGRHSGPLQEEMTLMPYTADWRMLANGKVHVVFSKFSF
jgi:hypothetical protein